MSRTIEEISVGTTSGAEYREQLRRVHTDLAAARSTISEQEMRIAELTEKVSFWQGEAGRWSGAFASERQRREEGEALLESVAPIVADAYATDRTHTFCLATEMIRQHLRKYEPGK